MTPARHARQALEHDQGHQVRDVHHPARQRPPARAADDDAEQGARGRRQPVVLHVEEGRPGRRHQGRPGRRPRLRRSRRRTPTCRSRAPRRCSRTRPRRSSSGTRRPRPGSRAARPIPTWRWCRCEIIHANYWDVKESKPVQLFAMAKAVVTGKPPRARRARRSAHALSAAKVTARRRARRSGRRGAALFGASRGRRAPISSRRPLPGDRHAPRSLHAPLLARLPLAADARRDRVGRAAVAGPARPPSARRAAPRRPGTRPAPPSSRARRCSPPFRELKGVAIREVNEPDVFRHFFGR